MSVDLHSVRHPFPLTRQGTVRRTFPALLVTPGQLPEMRQLLKGAWVEAEDLEDESVLFVHKRQWYRCHVDEWAEVVGRTL